MGLTLEPGFISHSDAAVIGQDAADAEAVLRDWFPESRSHINN